jgi:copper chaperone CopZ
MKTTIKIQNLKCNGCGNTITNNLKDIPTIQDIQIGVEDSTVSFEYENETALDDAKQTLKRLGYPEDGEANNLGSKAKSYVSCAIGKMS